MTRDEHLYTIAGEEGVEVAQRCSKALRFGGGEVQPGQELNNRTRILQEFADLVGVLEMLGFNVDIPPHSALRPWINAKKEKVERFLKYSKECGTLAAPVPPPETWQPIESAPKDGTRLLVYGCAHGRHWFGTGYYFKGVPGDSEGWVAHSFMTTPKDDCSGSFEPTHWMPLPDPPAAPHQDEPPQDGAGLAAVGNDTVSSADTVAPHDGTSEKVDK